MPLRRLIFGGNMLVKLGVLILFLGLAFLLRYAAERVTVPIELRFAGVAMTGAGLLGIGWFLRHRREGYALILQGAGIGVFYLTSLAAMKMYELLPPAMGFGFMFAVSVLSALLAVMQNAPALAIVAVLEGFAAPVLASTGGNQALGLFSYLWLLDVGIFLIAWFKAWRLLNVIGAVGTFALASGWAERHYATDRYGMVQSFLIVFFVMFALIGMLFARRTLVEMPAGDDRPVSQRMADALRRVGHVDSTLVFGTPMAAFALQYLLVRSWEFGGAFSALGFGAFYLALGWFILATQPRGLRLLAEAFAIVGAIFTTLSIPLALEGQWTSAAWAIEAAGVYWLGMRQSRPYARMAAFLLLLGAVMQLIRAMSIDPAAGQPLLHGSVTGALMVAAGTFAMWRLLANAHVHAQTVDGLEARMGHCLPWIGMAALVLCPWQTLRPQWAAVVTSMMALAVFVVGSRHAGSTSVASRGIEALRPVALCMHALAVLAYASMLVGESLSMRALHGSVSMALALGLSLNATWGLAWRTWSTHEEGWKRPFIEALPWAGMAAFMLVPWLILDATWAPAAAAVLALLTAGVALRVARSSSLMLIAQAMHAFSIAMVIDGLRFDAAAGLDGALMLEGGWQGMTAMGVVASGVIVTALLSGRGIARDGPATVEAPPRSVVRTLGLLAGIVLLHMAMLFGMDIDMAVMIWPLSALVVWGLGMRLVHEPLVALGASIHLVAALILTARFDGRDIVRVAFAHPGSWTALSLALTALVAADRLRAESLRNLAVWCARRSVLWGSLLWGLGWWLVAVLGEGLRLLDMHGEWKHAVALVVGVVVLTSVVSSIVGIRRNWRQLQQVTVATLPALVLAGIAGLGWGIDPPSTGLGWLAWSVALVWHLRLLRTQQDWLNAPAQSVLHVSGLWFFMLMATHECHRQLGRFGDAWSAWPLLGWVLVPTCVLWALCSPVLRMRWPIASHRQSYLEHGLQPVAFCLLGWIWLTNVMSAGSAAPLPFVPVLNPLELGQWLALAASMRWWSALPDTCDARLPPKTVKRLGALTAGALLTGAVLRACHHHAGVPWRFDALYGSTLTQAALSITWAICGVAAMLLGHRHGKRSVWVVGAVLMGVVVLKLFFVELADQGGLFRIVSFIGVGGLLLLVGYFAPVPPVPPSPKDPGDVGA